MTHHKAEQEMILHKAKVSRERKISTMQLCYVIDVTSSMASPMALIRVKCKEIMTYGTRYGDPSGLSFGVAIVAYRDYGDSKQFEVTPNISL
jgi:hypothetical protein